MRAVDPPPASMVSVVDAPRAVSSLASPARKLWADIPSIPAVAAAAWTRRLIWPGVKPNTGPASPAPGRIASRGGGGAVFRHADIGPVPGRIGLRGPDANQNGSFNAGRLDIGPSKGSDFAAAQAGLKRQPDQGGVFRAPLGSPLPETPSHGHAGAVGRRRPASG